MKKNMLYDKEVYEIQGAIFAVYREMDNAWHEGQLLNYRRITGMKLGILINFRSYPKVEILRLAN